MTHLYESHVEQLAIELLQTLGYEYLPPEAQEQERGELANVLLEERLQAAIARIKAGHTQGSTSAYPVPAIIDERRAKNKGFHLIN